MSPRIRYHANGTATLAGLPAGVLKGLLTAAALHCYSELGKKRPETPGHEAYAKRQLAVLDLIEKRDDEPRQQKYYYKYLRMRSLRTLAPHEITRRKAGAAEAAKTRKWIASVVEKITRRVA